MTVGTTYYGDTSANGIHIGNSNWQWQRGIADHAITATVANSSSEPLCPSGNNCLVLQYPTSDGTFGWPNYIYLSPTFSNWSGDPSKKNGTQAGGGIWFQYYIVMDSATYSYMESNGANAQQIKAFLGRYSSGSDYMQANGSGSDGGGGFMMPAISYHSCPSAMLTDLNFNDDVTTGGIIKNCPGGSTTPLITSGLTVKCQMRRDTTANLGHMACSANGVEIINTDAAGGPEPWWGCTGKFIGCNAYTTTALGGSPKLGTSDTGVIMDFHVGIRYFAKCSNGCADTTMKVVLSNVKVCDYNCVNYP
jgi:hypothetical protein